MTNYWNAFVSGDHAYLLVKHKETQVSFSLFLHSNGWFLVSDYLGNHFRVFPHVWNMEECSPKFEKLIPIRIEQRAFGSWQLYKADKEEIVFRFRYIDPIYLTRLAIFNGDSKVAVPQVIQWTPEITDMWPTYKITKLSCILVHVELPYLVLEMLFTHVMGTVLEKVKSGIIFK